MNTLLILVALSAPFALAGAVIMLMILVIGPRTAKKS
jgi:hypothetical protein